MGYCDLRSTFPLRESIKKKKTTNHFDLFVVKKVDFWKSCEPAISSKSTRSFLFNALFYLFVYFCCCLRIVQFSALVHLDCFFDESARYVWVVTDSPIKARDVLYICSAPIEHLSLTCPLSWPLILNWIEYSWLFLCLSTYSQEWKWPMSHRWDSGPIYYGRTTAIPYQTLPFLVAATNPR